MSAATHDASVTTVSTGGITIGTTRKIISKASSTNAHATMPASTAPSSARGWAASASSAAGDQGIGAEAAQDERKGGRADEQRHQ